MVKKILSIVAWIITGAALIVLFVFAYRGYNESQLQGVVFQLDRHGHKGFVEKDSTIASVEELCKIHEKTAVGDIDMMKIQRMLVHNPWIESASAYIGLNDTLVIKAKEYDPIMRVFNDQGRSVYVTDNGDILPASPRYTPRLIIASGNFEFPTGNGTTHLTDSTFAATGISEALSIAKVIRDDEFLKGSIGQIYRNDKKEYEVMVNDLQARVVIGDIDNLDHKMKRLRTLLEKYSGTEELGDFKTLDLRYKNQIVCTKK